MTLESFRASIERGGAPPSGLAPELAALWHAEAGNWDRAHEIAQGIPSATGARIHGLLHAIEGDFGNSAYWYRRAGQPPVRREQIGAEWGRLVEALLRSDSPTRSN